MTLCKDCKHWSRKPHPANDVDIERGFGGYCERIPQNHGGNWGTKAFLDYTVSESKFKRHLVIEAILLTAPDFGCVYGE